MPRYKEGRPKGRKTKPKARRHNHLISLPTELREHICDYVLYSECGRIGPVKNLFCFRQTCRIIALKTRRYFGKHAFRSIQMDMSLEGLEKIRAIAQTIDFANAVESILINNALAPMIHIHEINEFGLASLTKDKGPHHVQKFKKVFERMADISYMGQSGTDTAMLVMVLRDLPNLKRVAVSDVYEQWIMQYMALGTRTSDKYSAPYFFHAASATLAAVGLSGTSLKMLAIGSFSIGNFFMTAGMAIQALELPERNLCSFGSLDKLDLVLSTGNLFWKGIGTTPMKSLARFLRHTPGLRTAMLCFDDWNFTREVFAAVSFVKLPRLQSLRLQGFQYSQRCLLRFLGAHGSTLQQLQLRDCNLVTGRWPSVLSRLSTAKALSSLELHQLSESGYQTGYLGFEYASDNTSSSELSPATANIMDDYVCVSFKPYIVELNAEIDNIQDRLLALRNCYEVTTAFCRFGSVDYEWDWE